MEDLIAGARALARTVPPRFDVVVGIPRSGLIPATHLACEWHTPLWTWSAAKGLRDAGYGVRMTLRAVRGVLVVDDSASQGGQMRPALEAAKRRWPDVEVASAVVFRHLDGSFVPDYYADTFRGLGFFDWNWPNSIWVENAAFDIDGIVSENISPELCDGATLEETACAAAVPLHLPRRSAVPMFVTARHERLRATTEAWLARHAIRCGKLVMRDWPYCPGECRESRVAAWKAEIYHASDCNLFVESEPFQAEIIARDSGKLVLCPRAKRMIDPAAR